MLVVLDIASDYGRIGPLLPGAGPSLTIMTSGDAMVGVLRARRLVLDGLSSEEAVAILYDRIGKPQSREDPHLHEIDELYGMPPPALRITAASLANWGAWSTAAMLWALCATRQNARPAVSRRHRRHQRPSVHRPVL